MRRKTKVSLLAITVLLTLFGCGGDIGQRMLSDPELRTKVMDSVAGNTGMAGEMVDRLLVSDSTRVVVMDKVLANGPMVQAVMGRMATDRTMVEGILNLAVQDSSMRDHVMALLKGMQMVGAK